MVMIGLGRFVKSLVTSLLSKRQEIYSHLQLHHFPLKTANPLTYRTVCTLRLFSPFSIITEFSLHCRAVNVRTGPNASRGNREH